MVVDGHAFEGKKEGKSTGKAEPKRVSVESIIRRQKGGRGGREHIKDEHVKHKHKKEAKRE
jgi:hypothetical protein